MKKTVFIYSLLVYLSIGTLAAQRPIDLDPRCVVRDTNYDGYMFPHDSINHAYGIHDYYGWYIDSRGNQSNFWGGRYYTDTPIQVYGVACVAWGTPIIDLNYCFYWQGGLPIDGIDSLWGMLLQKEGGSYYTVRDSAKWNNQLRPGNNFYSGVRLWKPVLYFDIPWSPHSILPLSEFYFETPITVNDTFWVGIKNCDIVSYRFQRGSVTGIGAPGFQSDTTDYLYMYNHFYDNILVLNGNMEKDTEWMKHAPMGDFRYSFFPIIKPYEEDSVFCDTVPGFHLAGMRVGYPTFAWDTDWYREEELFEVQFAPYRSNNWVTVSTADSSIEVYSVFDPDIYYQARIRARRHHRCPIHDTVMWGPWCDPILFYTGPTEPDTTTSITPVEGGPDGLFTLSPNPATGTVRVSWSTGSIPAPAHSSPKLGEVPFRAEECVKSLTLTLTDAAGREVLRKALPAGTDSMELDLSGLAAGTYYVTLATPTATGTQRLVVK